MENNKSQGYCNILDRKFEGGYAHIKKEYILDCTSITKSNQKFIVEENENNATEKNKPNDSDQSFPCKRHKTGKNHFRPKLKKVQKPLKLCQSFWALRPGEVHNRDKCPYPKCPYNHDVAQYLKDKPKDLSGLCHNFEVYGHCPVGVMCRFGGNHIEGLGSKVDDEKYKKVLNITPFTNSIGKEVKILLRKKKYNFHGAEKAAEFARAVKPSPFLLGGTEESNSRLGPVSDEDLIKLRPQEKKKIDWRDKLYLAPLTTVGNLPFRRICKGFGADITCSEMAVATCLLQGNNSEWALVKKHSSEDCFGVQLCGSNVNAMVRCAQLLNDQIDVDFVDINMGCPIDLIYKQGAGCALMRRVQTVRQMVVGMNEVLHCPVTLKMRTAIYHNNRVACSFIKEAKLWDVNQITVHGRSREQRFIRSADWDYIDECAKAADPIPFFGNGDVLTFEDYQHRMKTTSVTGVMLARGALIKPWIFTEIKEQRHWDISSSERYDILKDYVNYGLEHWGSDDEGIEKTRRFLLEWLSFLYRYIPVGILEERQSINQRPPVYVGRNDLETLMASRNVKDWIKISEMLLGPVPSNFEFLPKHKANSWA